MISARDIFMDFFRHSSKTSSWISLEVSSGNLSENRSRIPPEINPRKCENSLVISSVNFQHMCADMGGLRYPNFSL